MNIKQQDTNKKNTALIIDVVKYYNEIDMFEARFNELKDSVDVFVVIESSMTCAGQTHSTTQFTENLKNVKPHLYHNHFIKHNAKPKIFHYYNNVYEKFIETKESHKIKWGNHWTGRDVMRTFELDFMTLDSKHFNETIYNITNGERKLSNALQNNDLIIISDIDEIPRGILLYFMFKKCGHFINNVKNLPIAFDFMTYKYDFGCQMTSNVIYDHDKSRISKLEWRHGGIIRYGQLKIDPYQCVIVQSQLINYDFRQLPSLSSNSLDILDGICRRFIQITVKE